MSDLTRVASIKEVKDMTTPRIQAMQKQVQELNDAGLRKTLLYENMAAEIQATKGEPRAIRRAKGFAYHLDHVALPVYPAEQLVGSVTGMWPVDPVQNAKTYEDFYAEAEKALDAYDKDRIYAPKPEDEKYENAMDGSANFEENLAAMKNRFGSLMARDHYDASIPFDTMQKLIKVFNEERKDKGYAPYEIGKVIEMTFTYDYGQETRDALHEISWKIANHTNLNYKDLVRRGYGDILREIKERLAGAEDEEKKVFYESTRIAIEGVIHFIEKYAKATQEEAEKTEDALRKEELLTLAKIMKKISTEKPDTFYEALDLVWMTQLIANLEGGSAMSLARFDQYMYPFYQRDMENGTLTRDRAFELICSLYLKLNEPKMRTVQSLSVGGVTSKGENGANELTKLCLEVMSLLALPYPNMSVRLNSKESPQWLYEEVIRTVKAGCGQPLVLNDDVWIPNLSSLGMPVEAARNYYNMGCTEIMIEGKDCNWISVGTLNLPEMLAEQIKEALEKGKTYADYAAFEAEYLDRVRAEVDDFGRNGVRFLENERKGSQDPFASALIEGCLEKGCDYFQGGTLLGSPLSINAQGMGTVSDSMSVIKRFVFETKEVALDFLYQAMEANFEGYELLRKKLEKAPCYGNDDDYADETAAKIWDAYSSQVRRQNEIYKLDNARFVNNVFSYNAMVELGELTPATPNGRKRGEAISDCIGPSQGKDSNGPTALMNSVFKMETKDITGAFALNMKISPSLVKDAEGTAAVVRLLQTYIQEKGAEVQFNYVDATALQEAQKEPSKHRDLVVRIAGYCEYFVNLDYKLQNEIIERTLHETA
ncbi:MAG: pyruvate formate lyase [Lachnospiraceae bacterium]|nr:pyruvate formate lyase [Lachnospiraceae bacterium]